MGKLKPIKPQTLQSSIKIFPMDSESAICKSSLSFPKLLKPSPGTPRGAPGAMLQSRYPNKTKPIASDGHSFNSQRLHNLKQQRKEIAQQRTSVERRDSWTSKQMKRSKLSKSQQVYQNPRNNLKQQPPKTQNAVHVLRSQREWGNFIKSSEEREIFHTSKPTRKSKRNSQKKSNPAASPSKIQEPA